MEILISGSKEMTVKVLRQKYLNNSIKAATKIMLPNKIFGRLKLLNLCVKKDEFHFSWYAIRNFNFTFKTNDSQSFMSKIYLNYSCVKDAIKIMLPKKIFVQLKLWN